jgi:Mrp family chromosome partitioning ATPase
LQESDVIRTLGGILGSGSTPDLTRLGWPTLRSALPLTGFPNAMREIRGTLARRLNAKTVPVLAVIGPETGTPRSVATLNIALAAARDGIKVLLIDADNNHALSNKLGTAHQAEARRFGWLSIGSRASRVVMTANNIAVLPTGGTLPAADAIRKAIAQTRTSGGFDLVMIDGPAHPWRADDHKLLDIADGLVAVLPASLDINGCMDDIIAGLGGAERKLVGVVIDELQSSPLHSQRSRLYA